MKLTHLFLFALNGRVIRPFHLPPLSNSWRTFIGGKINLPDSLINLGDNLSY